jgi:hypothetical protein
VFTGTLGGPSGFGTANTAFASGVGPWAPSVIGDKQTYRFTITVQNVAGAQNASASGVFTWEAQA